MIQLRTVLLSLAVLGSVSFACLAFEPGGFAPAKAEANEAKDGDVAKSKRAKLIAASVQHLIERQEKDGAWPYEGTWKYKGKQTPGFRVGSTSLVVSTLLYAAKPADRAAQTAIDRGIDMVLEDLKKPAIRPEGPKRWDPFLWGEIYALDMLCRVRAAKRMGDYRSAIARRIPKLLKILAEREIKGGGWNYAGQDRQATFVTSATVQALLWAKSQGEKFDRGLLVRARTALLSSRYKNGAFRYQGANTRPLAMNGAVARSPYCELTLALLGRDKHELPALVIAFHDHWDELSERRGRTGHHVRPHGIAPYYFFYGHSHVAQAVRFLPKSKQEAEYRWLEDCIRKTVGSGGTWNDRVFKPCASACTAMAIITLLGEGYPLPAPTTLEESD